jgi:hypothetical protein
MESILETSAATILQFFAGRRGRLVVTFEESTCAAWLYDLLKPHVAELVVCNPRKNYLLKEGDKSDRIDARKLAELLRGKLLKPVYHGETGVRTLRELARGYLTTVKDLTRVMHRLKAIYRSWAIPCAGRDVYYARHRAEWLKWFFSALGTSVLACSAKLTRKSALFCRGGYRLFVAPRPRWRFDQGGTGGVFSARVRHPEASIAARKASLAAISISWA